MPSKYARQMKILSNRIFGEVWRPTDQKSRKVLKIFEGVPPHLDPNKVNYYPRLIQTKNLFKGLRYHGIYRDEHADYKEEMERRRVARGKVGKVPYHIQQRLEREKNEQLKSVASES